MFHRSTCGVKILLSYMTGNRMEVRYKTKFFDETIRRDHYNDAD